MQKLMFINPRITMTLAHLGKGRHSRFLKGLSEFFFFTALPPEWDIMLLTESLRFLSCGQATDAHWELIHVPPCVYVCIFEYPLPRYFVTIEWVIWIRGVYALSII